jgi:DUF4097 and DUF4098 domain-containing protein YvlB
MVVEMDGRGGDQIRLEQLGDEVRLVRSSAGVVRGNPRILVRVPPGSGVEVSAAALDLVVEVPVLEVVASTASGDVSVAAVETLQVRTASGDVRVDRVSYASAATASGDILLGEVLDGCECSTASGDIRIRQGRGRVELRSASGDVTVERFEGVDLEAKTLSGDVQVGLVPGCRLEVDVSTLSGAVRLPEAASPSESEPGDRRRVRLRVRSISGDVDLQRMP